MTLIVYLVCLALLSFLLRNWSQRFRSLLITGFNLVFAALMFFSVQVHPGMTGGEVFALDSVYMRSSQNSQPNSDTSDVNSRKER